MGIKASREMSAVLDAPGKILQVATASRVIKLIMIRDFGFLLAIGKVI
jgi:hypothetical protein